MKRLVSQPRDGPFLFSPKPKTIMSQEQEKAPEHVFTDTQYPKWCSCDRCYVSLEQFRNFTSYVGEHADEFGKLEMRNCACGSTLGIYTEIYDLSKE